LAPGNSLFLSEQETNMLLKRSIFSFLCALGVAWASEPPACFSADVTGEDGYKACCANQDNGEGTVGGVVFQYTCQTFLKKGNDYGTTHWGVSSARECAQLCAGDSSCEASSWGSGISRCFLLSSKGYIRYTPNRGFLILEKKPEEQEKPDSTKDCQDLVDAGKKEGEAQCAAEKDKLRQEGEEALRECQKQKEATVTESKTLEQLQKCKDDLAACKKNEDKLAECESKAASGPRLPPYKDCPAGSDEIIPIGNRRFKQKCNMAMAKAAANIYRTILPGLTHEECALLCALDPKCQSAMSVRTTSTTGECQFSSRDIESSLYSSTPDRTYVPV
jgi:hypothetical protein